MIQIRYRTDLKFCGEEKDDNPPFPSLEGVPVPNGIVLFTGFDDRIFLGPLGELRFIEVHDSLLLGILLFNVIRSFDSGDDLLRRLFLSIFLMIFEDSSWQIFSLL